MKDTKEEKIDITLGVDIGGTNTVMGFVERSGLVVVEKTFPTRGSEPASMYFERFHEHAKTLLASIGERYQLLGIGIGAPNANYYRGTVEFPPNLKWEGITPVVDIVQEQMNVPVVITNDANAAAMGEMVFGAAKGLKHVVVITLGTGVGSGIIVNGKLLYGADGFAGEIGHTTVDLEGRLCGCGKKGCLETYASAGGICKTVVELLEKSSVPSELRKIDKSQLTSKNISDAARKGDSIALEAFQVTGKILGVKLADTVAHLSPQAIILFGGLATAEELIFEPTKKSMEEHLFGVFKNKVKLLPSGLSEGNSAVLGASALIWDELEKRENKSN